MVSELGVKVDPGRQEIRFDDQIVKQEPKVYWLLHKPKGVLCTSKDSHGRKTVLDLMPLLGKRVYSVGRLDADSTGLILLTNDGEMALRLTHPRYQAPKTYIALVAGRVPQEALDSLEKGVWLSEGKVRAHSIKRMGSQGQATRLQVVLKEGRNREIRRMFAKLGHKVMSLHRVAIGPLKIRKLTRGESRPATPEEVYMLRRLARLERGAVQDGGVAEEKPAPRSRPRRAPQAAERSPRVPRKAPGKRIASAKAGPRKRAKFGGKRPR
jgi:23S rRNA pseudouridine2605 synthase